jgi:hypothetical protein
MTHLLIATSPILSLRVVEDVLASLTRGKRLAKYEGGSKRSIHTDLLALPKSWDRSAPPSGGVKCLGVGNRLQLPNHDALKKSAKFATRNARDDSPK